MSKLTIAFVLERLGNGGAERVTSELANYYVINHIAEVHIFTYVKENNEYILNENVHRHILNSNSKNKFMSMNAKIKFFTKNIKHINPDIVISLATPRTSILLTLLSLSRKYTLILSERNDPNQYPKEYYIRMLRKIAYRKCDGVVFQTSDAQGYFDGSIRAHSTVIPNPISSNLPTRNGNEARENRIVNFCRLEKQKNIPLLIDAFSLVVAKHWNYKLEIYGEGDQKELLKAYSTQSGLSDKIDFLPFAKDIHNKVINAAMFVSSSNYEGISNSMMEALAIGLPTICTDCPIGGARMVIEDRVNGLLVPVNDKYALADAMNEFIENSEIRKTCENNAVCIREKFSIDSIAHEWLDFIYKIRR